MATFSNPTRTIGEEAIVDIFSELVLSNKNNRGKPFVLIRKSHTKLVDEKFKEIELVCLTQPRAEAKKLLEFRQIKLAFQKISRSVT